MRGARRRGCCQCWPQLNRIAAQIWRPEPAAGSRSRGDLHLAGATSLILHLAVFVAHLAPAEEAGGSRLQILLGTALMTAVLIAAVPAVTVATLGPVEA